MAFIILSMHYLHYLFWLIILTVYCALNEMCLWNASSRFESLWPSLISSSPFLPPACGQAFDLAASCSSCLLPCCPCHHGTISQNNAFFIYYFWSWCFISHWNALPWWITLTFPLWSECVSCVAFSFTSFGLHSAWHLQWALHSTPSLNDIDSSTSVPFLMLLCSHPGIYFTYSCLHMLSYLTWCKS